MWVENFAESIRGKRVKPVMPEGRSPYAPASEVEADSMPHKLDHSASASVIISYVDSRGERSERPITLNSIQGGGSINAVLRCFCHLKERPRSFRLDRIEEMACERSGEILDPLEHCLLLHRNGALKISDDDLTSMMRIVTFVARCDGDLHRLECEQIDEIIGRYLRFFGGDDTLFECARREATHLAPTDSHVLKSVDYLVQTKNAPELARFALRAIGEVIDADGRHRESELDWAAILQSGLKEVASTPR